MHDTEHSGPIEEVGTHRRDRVQAVIFAYEIGVNRSAAMRPCEEESGRG